MGLLRGLLSFYQTPVAHARGGGFLDLPSCCGQSRGADQTNSQDRDSGCLPLSCFLTSRTCVKMHVVTKTLFALSRQDAHLLHSVLHRHAAQSITGITCTIPLQCWGDMDGTVRCNLTSGYGGECLFVKTVDCSSRDRPQSYLLPSQRGFLLPSHLFKMYSLALYHPCLPSIAVRH